jgi:hypothetical protein
MPLVATRGGASAFGLGWSAASAGEELGGMVLLTPTSIAYTGTSASIGTNGSVEFTACTSFSLNGVFSADYDNYQIVVRHSLGTTDNTVGFRLRNSGSDDSTANSYVYQALYVSGASIVGVRTTSNTTYHLTSSATAKSGEIINVYGPYLSQPTAIRNVSISGSSSAIIQDVASTHNQSTPYDGFTIYPTASSISGLVSVYGLVGA